MANATITAWLKLSNPNYETGVALFDQFGTSNLLKIFFSKGKGDYHLSRLKEALKKLNEELTEPSRPVAMITPAVKALPVSPKIHSLTDNEWNQAPDAIKDLYVLNHQLKSHAEFLHHQIRIEPYRERRLSMALELLNDRDSANANWQIIRNYNINGKVNEQIIKESAPTIDKMTMAELTAVLKNFPTYITKDNAKLAGMPDGSKKNKILQRLQERKVQLELAKKRLENVQLV